MKQTFKTRKQPSCKLFIAFRRRAAASSPPPAAPGDGIASTETDDSDRCRLTAGEFVAAARAAAGRGDLGATPAAAQQQPKLQPQQKQQKQTVALPATVVKLRPGTGAAVDTDAVLSPPPPPPPRCRESGGGGHHCRSGVIGVEGGLSV